MDPLEFRLRNCLQPGSTTATGQVLQDGVGIEACLRRLSKIYRAWDRRVVSDERTLRGIGLGAMFYGIGNTGVSNPSSAQLELSPKGHLTLFTGAAEIGQGSDTVLSQIAARYFGLSLDQIRLVRGDTARTTSAGAPRPAARPTSPEMPFWMRRGNWSSVYGKRGPGNFAVFHPNSNWPGPNL